MQRRFNQIDSLEDRLAQEAVKLRKQAQGTPAGIERERLIRRAQQAAPLAVPGAAEITKVCHGGHAGSASETSRTSSRV
jgi:hypothetical protein